MICWLSFCRSGFENFQEFFKKHAHEIIARNTEKNNCRSGAQIYGNIGDVVEKSRALDVPVDVALIGDTIQTFPST